MFQMEVKKMTEITVKSDPSVEWKKGDVVHINTGEFEDDFEITEVTNFRDKGMAKTTLKLVEKR